MKPKNPFKFVLIALLFVSVYSCTPAKRIARILQNHPELIKSDTIHVTDTIITAGVKKDSSFYFYQKDTIVIKKDNLIMKYFFNTDSTIYLSGEIKTDTIYKDRIITINSVSVEQHLKWYEKLQRFFIGNFFWVVIVAGLLYLVFRLVKKYLF